MNLIDFISLSGVTAIIVVQGAIAIKLFLEIKGSSHRTIFSDYLNTTIKLKKELMFLSDKDIIFQLFIYKKLELKPEEQEIQVTIGQLDIINKIFKTIIKYTKSDISNRLNQIVDKDLKDKLNDTNNKLMNVQFYGKKCDKYYTLFNIINACKRLRVIKILSNIIWGITIPIILFQLLYTIELLNQFGNYGDILFILWMVLAIMDLSLLVLRATSIIGKALYDFNERYDDTDTYSIILCNYMKKQK